MSDRISILKNVYISLDSMPLAFGIPKFDNNMSNDDIERYIGKDLNDALRMMRLKSTDDIEEMSHTELVLENCAVYCALRRFRNSASVFFKFSTAVDGKTVDKSMIPKMINEIINEYYNEFRSYANAQCTGSQWTMNSTVRTGGDS